MNEFNHSIPYDIEKLVKDGYNRAAEKHSENVELMDASYTHVNSRIYLDIYKQFKAELSGIGGRIIELGCGDGLPIGKDLLDGGFQYTGIDLSESQIELARKNNQNHQSAFIVGEMLSVMQSHQKNSIAGVCAFFSIFHIPRTHHVSLLSKIYDSLKPDGVFLITCGPAKWEDINKNWLVENNEMFWSSFSNKWYEITLQEVGFSLISMYRTRTKFNNRYEIQYFYLFKK